MQISSWSSSELQELQDLDSDIAIVKKWVQEGQSPQKCPENGSDVLKTLYRMFPSFISHVFRMASSIANGYLNLILIRSKVLFPNILHQRLLTKFISNFAILGFIKHLMQSSCFYWPGFHRDIENFCKSCTTCAKNKLIPHPRKPLQPIAVKLLPFHMVGIDIIGPLKVTHRGNRYILSVIDFCTKYGEALALPNQETETVICAVEEVFSLHGMPSISLTDQGSNVESHLFVIMCRLFGIEKRRTTPYHPQTDGLCERFNQILKLLLRMCVNKDQDDWDDQLPSVLLSYHISKQESAGVSPFERMYG